jgi:hypothetical protein
MEDNYGFRNYPNGISQEAFEKDFLENSLKAFDNNTACPWTGIGVKYDN